MGKRTVSSVTTTELVLLVAIVSNLNPDKYTKAAAKALIYKCKDFIEDPPDRVKLVD